MVNLIYIILLLLFNSSINRIISVIQFMRHGARSPLMFNELITEFFGNYKPGELTNVGYSMAYEKGLIMRNTYKYEDLVAITTPTQRTMYTSYSYLSGIFEEALIEFKTLGEKQSNIYKEMNSKYLKKKVLVNIIGYNNKIFFKDFCVDKKYINKYLTNEEWKIIRSVDYLFPGIIKLFCSGKNENECFKDNEMKRKFAHELAGFFEIINFNKIKDIPSDLQRIAFKYYYLDSYNYNDNDIIKSGTLMFRIINRFFDNDCSNYSNSKNRYEKAISEILNLISCKKHVIFFSHDNVLTDILKNMFDFSEIYNLFDKKGSYNELKEEYSFWWPVLLSDITIELHEDNVDKYIKVFYNGKEMNERKYQGDIIKYSSKGIKLSNFQYFLKSRIDRNFNYSDKC